MAVQLQRYEVLNGKHSEGSKVFQKGETFESPEPDLTERFPGRFKAVETLKLAEPDVKRPKIVVGKVTDDKKSPEAAEVKEDAALAARGKDVTSEFKVEKGLKVFSREDLFHVYEDSSTTALNKTGLKKDKVEPFIVKWLTE